MSIFPTASESRIISDLKVVHTEVRLLESAVLDARDLGERVAVITDSPMAISVPHWEAFKRTVPNDRLISQQNQVIEHFEFLNYSIVRVTNITTNNTFNWEIRW